MAKTFFSLEIQFHFTIAILFLVRDYIHSHSEGFFSPLVYWSCVCKPFVFLFARFISIPFYFFMVLMYSARRKKIFVPYNKSREVGLYTPNVEIVFKCDDSKILSGVCFNEVRDILDSPSPIRSLLCLVSD